MTQINEIASLLLIISFLWYTFSPQAKSSTKESFVVNQRRNLEKDREVVNNWFKYNMDLNVQAERNNLELNHLNNIRTRSLSPTIG